MPERTYIFDSTVLSNFAAAGRVDLLETLYRSTAYTTVAIADELQRGINAGYDYLSNAQQCLSTVNPDGWLTVLALETVDEQTSYAEFSLRLDPGEASCLAVAVARKMTLASDDLAARRMAEQQGVRLTGTVGILLRLVRQQHVSLEDANGLLAEMIQKRYRSPVDRLDDLV